VYPQLGPARIDGGASGCGHGRRLLRSDRRKGRRRTVGHDSRQFTHRVDRRRDHGNPLRIGARSSRRRNRLHELLPAAGATREAERRLHARAVARRRARAQSLAHPCDGRRRAERNHHCAARRRHSLRAGAGQVQRQEHPREDRDRRGRRRRRRARAPASPRRSLPTSTHWRRSAPMSSSR